MRGDQKPRFLTVDGVGQARRVSLGRRQEGVKNAKGLPARHPASLETTRGGGFPSPDPMRLALDAGHADGRDEIETSGTVLPGSSALARLRPVGRTTAGVLPRTAGKSHEEGDICHASRRRAGTSIPQYRSAERRSIRPPGASGPPAGAPVASPTRCLRATAEAP